MNNLEALIAAYPILSSLVGLALLMLLMYFVRAQGHRLILLCGRSLYRQLRLMSRASLHAAQRIRLRNHEVIKALAEALIERQLERRFLRIEKLVERDLNNYQQLAGEINRHLAVMDEDYQASTKVPEVSAEWVAAVDAIANLQAGERNSEVMIKILEDVHRTVKEHQRDALREHRWTVASRHKLLAGLQPRWRKLIKLLQQIDNNVSMLRQRLRQVDQHMGQFEIVTAGSGQGIMSSMLMRFVSSLCFVLVGAAAAWLNWLLLQQPLDNIFPAAATEASLSALMALLHIAITVVAAAMLTDSLRITHFFPLTTAMSRRGRHLLVGVASAVLVILIAVEALALYSSPATGYAVIAPAVEAVSDEAATSGASMAPEAAQDEAVSNVAAAAEPAAVANGSEVSQWLLLLLGLLMPMVLALVVIPLEYLLHTIRPVAGSSLQLLLHVATLLLRQLADVSIQLSRLLVLVYDVVIFIPLQLERYWHSRQLSAATAEEPTAEKELDGANVTALDFGRERR